MPATFTVEEADRLFDRLGLSAPPDQKFPLPVPTPGHTAGRSDLERALDLCGALCADSDTMRFLVIPGAPYSKSRPRSSRDGHVYVKKQDRQQEDLTGWYLRTLFSRPLTGNVALGCIFFRPNRQRIDADNMLKHVCDAASGIVYHDDEQVTGITGLIELDADNPRTVIMVGEHTTTLTRGTDATTPCPECGQPMSLIGRTARPEFCSRTCRNKADGLDLTEPVPCAQCSKPFKRTTRAQKLCSPQCRADRLRNAHKNRATPNSRCAECNKQLSHKRGGRCRDCWRANPTGSGETA
jgi:Holliday junction resolvase RusA-like endonuclease/ssDNA-binding Zn-finger/Zn-ribbon topoisomerase 1